MNPEKCELARRNVLIVEDNLDISATLQMLLESEGYVVSVAANGAEAIGILKCMHKKNDPCLIFLDLMMPVMNGWEFLDSIQENDYMATIPVVVTTAGLSCPKGKRLLKKPYQLDSILKVANEFCRGVNEEAKQKAS